MRVPKEEAMVRSLVSERDRLLQRVAGLNAAIEALGGGDAPRKRRRKRRGRKRSSRAERAKVPRKRKAAAPPKPETSQTAKAETQS